MTPKQKQHYMYLLHMTSGAKLLWHRCKAGYNEPVIPLKVLAKLSRFAAWAIVPCCEQLHLVVISKKGRIGLLSHSTQEVHRWRNFTALGGQAPDCMKWLGLMKFYDSDWVSRDTKGPVGTVASFNPDSDSLPEKLAKLYGKAKIKRINRGFKRGRMEGTIT